MPGDAFDLAWIDLEGATFWAAGFGMGLAIDFLGTGAALFDLAATGLEADLVAKGLALAFPLTGAFGAGFLAADFLGAADFDGLPFGAAALDDLLFF